MAAQDMPPPGGFGSIPIERTFPKPIMRQSILAVSLALLTINGMWFLREYKKRHRIIRMEEQEHYIAMAPFLYAEQERKYLRQLKKVRAQEKELMKDVPGWESDSFFGEKVYKTIPENQLMALPLSEYTLGRPGSDWLWNSVSPDWWK